MVPSVRRLQKGSDEADKSKNPDESDDPNDSNNPDDSDKCEDFVDSDILKIRVIPAIPKTQARPTMFLRLKFTRIQTMPKDSEYF